MNLRTERHTRPHLIGGVCRGTVEVTGENGDLYRVGVTCAWNYRASDLGTARSHVNFIVHVEHPYGGWHNIGNDVSLELRDAILPTYQAAVQAAGRSVVARKLRLRKHLETWLIEPNVEGVRPEPPADPKHLNNLRDFIRSIDRVIKDK